MHYKEHLARKERARVCKELDEQFAIKNADTTRVVTMDVQQLLLKLQFSSTKSIDNKTYNTRSTSKFRVKYILYSVLTNTALMIKAHY